MIGRRAAIGVVVGSAFAAGTVLAQRVERPARIGFLALNSAGNPHQIAAFRQGLRELGWREGENAAIDVRDAGGLPDRLGPLARELALSGADVIVAGPTLSTLAAMAAVQTTPIVFPVAADPIGSGLVASLARPGGNVTGLSLLAANLVGKCLELLTELAPGTTRVAAMWQPGGHSRGTDAEMVRQTEAAAQSLGLGLQLTEVRGPGDIEGAFAAMQAAGSAGLLVLPYAMLFQQRTRLVGLAAARGLPAVYPWREFVDEGGLASYGANTADLYRRAAGYVDRILKGAHPSELPVEQPTKFEALINLRTARSLGLSIPALALARADEVIE